MSKLLDETAGAARIEPLAAEDVEQLAGLAR